MLSQFWRGTDVQVYCYLISSLSSTVEVTAGAALSVTVNLNGVFAMAAVGAPVPPENPIRGECL
jgi:hypothetical protein